MNIRHVLDHTPYRVKPGTKVKLKQYDPESIGPFTEKTQAEKALTEDVASLAEAQELLFASDTYAILLILQAMDAAGKDGAIKHVMSGVNPQGCQVASFKQPSAEEIDHDFLWRCNKALPERGRIGIFNRSYYEEVLIVRVHRELLEAQRIPNLKGGDSVWRERFEDINSFEHYLYHNGTVILKFFLNVSKEEQRKRFLERLNDKEKLWKFSVRDALERVFWDDYMRAYEEMLSATSTEHAPWYVIPADKKWFARACVADIIAAQIDSLKLKYPIVSEERKRELLEVKRQLEFEGSKK
jgi:PPK2 family polyphosphate:nucleotide phosphotransferase